MTSIPDKETSWQQPAWDDRDVLSRVKKELNNLPTLIENEEITDLYRQLALVYTGKRVIFQAGDCAERICESGASHVRKKLTFLDQMSREFSLLTGLPVVSVGRIAGQYTKPRSQHSETYANEIMPVWRGDSVNKPEATQEARRNDPERMLLSYRAAAETLKEMKRFLHDQPSTTQFIWTSHEALLLDYESAQIRATAQKDCYLASTHWPWVGIRTLALDSPHIAMLSRIANPVACKIDATVSPSFIAALCRQLNPRRIQGRLTFIARFGHKNIHQLGALVDAVKETAIPVLWMCDPMHGNTQKTPAGNKRRDVNDMMAEIAGFLHEVTSRNACAAGLHLEATPCAVVECFSADYRPQEYELKRIACDPRLNTAQTQSLLHYWKELLKNDLK